MPFYDSWSLLVEEINVLHRARKTSAQAKTQQGIVIFKDLLEQCTTDEFTLEPLNNAERLEFISENAASYAAFRQLQELFNELQKKIAAKRVMLSKPQ